MNKIILILMLLGVSLNLWANPIVEMPSTFDVIKLGMGFTPRVLISLLAETLVISILLCKWKFDPIRIIYTWIFITLISFWLFVLCYAVFNNFASFWIGLSDKTYVTLLELIVALVEAKAILILSRYRFYRKGDVPAHPGLWGDFLLFNSAGRIA